MIEEQRLRHVAATVAKAGMDKQPKTTVYWAYRNYKYTS